MDAHIDTQAEDRDLRNRILDAAAALTANGDITSLTTRTIAAAAAVQAPTLYRLFGDKQGLLDAVAERIWAAFVKDKAAMQPHADPVQDLREAWDRYVSFGLANPVAFAIMHGARAGSSTSTAVAAGLTVLRERVSRVAKAGRLSMPVERAVGLIHAMGLGTVTSLLAVPAPARDPQLATAARDAVLSAIVDGSRGPAKHGLAPCAVALGARLDESDGLTPGERMLLGELLTRLASPPDKL